MFDSTYPVIKVSREKAFSSEFHDEIVLYRFDADDSQRYLIYVTYYPEHFFTVDFCRRISRNARHKWTELVNSGDGIKVLSTVVRLMIRLLVEKSDDHFSCGFIGATMLEDKDRTGSKRFHLYRRIMLNLVDRNQYIHLEDAPASAYVLLHAKADRERVLAVAREVFDKEEEE